MSRSDQELLDVLDADGRLTGITKPRAEVHRDGDWHRSFHLWIVKEGRYVLFQRRAQFKGLEPNKIDVTVGGHLAAGETIRDAWREVEEELGLRVDLKDLIYLETRRAERRYALASDREFQEVYLLRCDQELSAYNLNPQEVYALYELPFERAIALYRDGTPQFAAGYDAYQRINNALLIDDDLIAQAKADVLEALMKIQALLGHTA
ncbi:MAG: NUDIX domain-containing protein [Truepera sp.]|nr:NUDIX domain-containing protein [Truepera sp.]